MVAAAALADFASTSMAYVPPGAVGVQAKEAPAA
jgi:hypothetical protein